MKEVEVPILVDEGVSTPQYQTAGAAGADVCALLEHPITIEPGKSVLIPTGLKAAIPQGYEIQIRPRSGLAAKHQIVVLNSPGTIDSDYRGEIKVILINHGQKDFIVEPDMRIAQFVLAPVVQARFVEHETLVSSARGAGGFGHTGVQ